MLSSGVLIGPYEVLAPLGAGGMGEVYRARDTRLGREVAVKVLPAALTRDAEALRRLELEAKAVAALNHPNLLSVFDIGQTADGSPYMVAELLEGETLRQRLGTGPVPQRRAVEYGIEIARGLAAAHSKGIIHRDLKPENIFCCTDGRIKILDFGLAKATAAALADANTLAAGASPATSPGVTLGTVGYMSPEQVRGQAADARSDIFSFGATFYEMISGEKAFRGATAADVMSAILREEPAELSTSASTITASTISPALSRLVRHCLEKESRQRFQSADDLAFQLQEISQVSGVASSSFALPVQAHASRRRLIFAMVGTAGLVATAALAWWGARVTSPKPLPHWQQVTFQQGFVTSARFLPDGQSFLTSAIWSGDTALSLQTRRLDSPGLQQLNLAGDGVLSVSKSGEAAILLGDPGFRSGQAGTLARMPISGGAPRAELEHVVSADWAPDGSNLTIARETLVGTLEYPPGHILVQTTGWIGDVRFSRDGRHIAFFDHPFLGDDRGHLAVVDLQGSAADISPDYSTAAGLAWSPDGKGVWFTAGNNSVRSLYAATLDGRVALLLQAPGKLTLNDVLPDGRALVGFDSQREILMLVAPDHPQGRDVSILLSSYTGIVSDDGKQILIGEQSDGPNYGTFLRNVSSSGPSPGAPSTAADSPPVRLGDGNPVALSPDGKWAVSAVPTRPQQLLLLPAGTGQPRQLTHGDVNYGSLGAWLPDSRSFVINGSLLGHDARTFLIDVDGNTKAITPEGWLEVAVSPDGKQIMAAHDHHYYFVPISGGAGTPVPSLQPGDAPLRFGSTADEIYVSHRSELLAHQIFRVNVRTGQHELAFQIDPPDRSGFAGLGNISLSQNGKTYSYSFNRDLGALYVVSGLGH